MVNRDFLNIIGSYWKYLSPTAILLLAYLQTQFVPKEEFQKHTEKITVRVEKIEQILIRMESSVEADKRHENSLNDHETRIRTIENKVR
jgi:hypothetical protein